jgi:hypothetical protein
MNLQAMANVGEMVNNCGLETGEAKQRIMRVSIPRWCQGFGLFVVACKARILCLHTGSVRDDVLSTIGDRRSKSYIVSVAPTHETFRRTVSNMALGVGPSISLAVSSTTKKNPATPFGSTALSLAAEFNRELVGSKSDADKAKICRSYRDMIMRISTWADDIAAAFTDAFAPFLHKSQ